MINRNKNDVREEDKVVSAADGEEFARANGLLFLEASAKTGFNVDNAFIMTAREIMNRIKRGEMELGEKGGVKKVDEKSDRVSTLPSSANGANSKKGCC